MPEKIIQEDKLSIATKMQEEMIVYSNLGLEVIQVTTDKLELCLKNNLDKQELKGNWLAYFGTFMTVTLTLLTASFKDAFGLSQHVWFAIFIIMDVILFGVCLLLIKDIFYKIDIKKIIKTLKKEEKC